jgi:hypothetical protein
MAVVEACRTKKDQPLKPLGNGPVKLMFGRRYAVPILETVLAAKEPHIHRAAVYLIKVDIPRCAILGRDILEYEDLEVAG